MRSSPARSGSCGTSRSARCARPYASTQRLGPLIAACVLVVACARGTGREDRPTTPAPTAETCPEGAGNAHACAGAQAPPPPPSPPTPAPICDVPGGEEAVARVIAAEVGMGLLWIAVDPGTGVRKARASVGRARELTHCLLRYRDAGFDAALGGGHSALEAWLDRVLGSPEDAPILMAAGTAYFAGVLSSPSPVDAMLDVPIALALLERATKFDRHAQEGLGLLLLGAYDCYMPAPMGGHPERGSARLREVAGLENGLQMVAMVVEADLCAVVLQDRERFDALLDAVVGGRTEASAFEVPAVRRARALRAEVDDLFME